MRGCVRRCGAVLVVTHEMGFAREVSDQVAFMDGGRIVQHGDPDSVLRNPSGDLLRAFLSRVS